MEQILHKKELYRIFSTEWSEKWAVAVINYCRTLKRKDVKEYVKKLGDGRFQLITMICKLILYIFRSDLQ